MKMLKAIEIFSLVYLVSMAAGTDIAKASEAAKHLRHIQMEFCDSRAVAAVVHFQTRHESVDLACGREYPGGPDATPDSRFLIASVSKLFLSVTLLQQQERGVLNIDDPVTRWLSAGMKQAFGRLDGISIAHLLSMTSGLPDYLTDEFDDDVRQMVRAGRGPREILLYALESVAGEPRLFAPGTAFDYSNTNYLLAQLVLEEATGKPMQAVLRESVFGPAGLETTSVLGFENGAMVTGFGDFGDGPVATDAYHAWFGFGDGGLVATAADVARFYRALFVSRDLLTEESLERLLLDPLTEGYGLGVAVERFPDGTVVVGHGGEDIGFSSDVRHIIGADITAVVLVAETNADVSVAGELLETFMVR